MDRRTRVEWMRLLHGELQETDASRLRERIRSRPDHEEAFLELEESWQGLELPPPEPAPIGFAARVTTRASAESGSGPVPSWWRQTLAGRAATAAVLAGGIVLGALIATPSETDDFNDYLTSEPSWAESYLAGVEATDGWPEDES